MLFAVVFCAFVVFGVRVLLVDRLSLMCVGVCRLLLVGCCVLCVGV